jgi:branched-chain amino acid transport system substrate-binding protein
VWDDPINRRTLLKRIGAGAVILGAGPLVEACSNLPGASQAVQGATSGATGTINIGLVTPLTGPLAGFASGDNFVVNRIRSTAFKSGLKIGSKTYDVNIEVKDSQSDPNIAAQVAQQLVLSKTDLVLTTSTPETTNPVAQTCEAHGIPCLSTVVPWQAWYFGRQADPANPKPFKYTTMFFFGAESFGGCFEPMWQHVMNNKVVAGQFPNDADGNAFRAYWSAELPKKGYTYVDGGAYPDGTTDYTSMIGKFMDAQADIFINAPLPPDFNTFWKQAAQQGFKPKIATVAKVLLFPSDTQALGNLVNNIATDCWWTPAMPYKSSLTGESAKDLADAYQSSSGKQWLQSLGSTYSLFEVANAALGTVDDPHDHNQVADALFKVSYTGICGPLDFSKGPQPGIGIMRPLGVQWQPGKNYPWEMVVVDNSLNPDVSVDGTLNPTNP